jgi:transposase
MRLGSKEAQEYRRQQILTLHKEGYGQADIARLLKCSQCWVSRILKRVKEEGEQSLKAKGSAPGKTPALSSAQLQELRKFLEGEAAAAGFETDGWTRHRVAHLINERFSVSHDLSHISRILQKLGFSLQKPQRRDYRQDAAAVSKWRDETLPQLKKS